MSDSVRNTFNLIERELIKFGSYENAKRLLNKYMIGSSYDKEMTEKILVILVSEFRHEIDRMKNALPEDDVEAAASVERKVSNKRASKKMDRALSIEPAGEDVVFDEED